MPTLSLLQNLTAAWQQNAVVTNYFNMGPQFFPEHDGEIRGLSWYRASTGTLKKPSRLQLWDVATSTKLEETTNAPDNEAVGWQTYTFATPIQVLAGQVLCCTIVQPVGNTQAYLNAGTRPPPPNGLAYQLYDRRYVQNAVTFPTTQDTNATMPAVDVVYFTDAEVSETGQEATVGDVRTVLSEWLHDTENTHPTTSLPAINKAKLDTIKAQLDADLTDVVAILGTNASSGTLTTMGRLATLLPIVATITSIAADLASMIGSLGPGAPDDVHDKLDQLLDQPVPSARAPQDVLPMADVGWTQGDTEVGNGSFHWDHPADRYVLTITAYGSARPYNEVGGIPYWLHRGFWAVVDDDRVGHYYPIAGHKHMLYEVGSRLPGVLICLDDDIEWTLTAFDYTA